MKVKPSKQILNRSRPNNVKPNPFEVHINRSKHQVLGRKLKSDKGMPGISKHRAFKKRKDTLLQEYKFRHKTNHFIDQRIGERNSGMTEDDKIMARFTAERMRMFNKKTLFNLSDSEVLTHRGQTLSEIERFEDTRSDEEDDEDRGKRGDLKGKFVGDAHFGGGMLTKNKQDRESLIDELINESKKRKAERQRNKEETLEATEKLDEDWKVLGQITTSVSEDDTNKESINKSKEDHYDIVMRQLKFEPHGQASQRLKTDEEIAKEDKEKLEKLEQERLKQLREIEANKFGYHRSSDDIDDGFSNLTNDFLACDDDNIENNSDSSSENDMEIDNKLTDSNTVDMVEQSHSKHLMVENKHTDRNIENKRMSFKNENTTEDCEKNCNTDDSEFISNLTNENCLASDGETENESSDEECAMEDLTDLMPAINEVGKNDQNTKSGKIKETSKSHIKSIEESNEVVCSQVQVDLDLPYVLGVPKNFESFKELIKKHSTAQQNVIFERLLKSNHPSLEPGNKKEMLKLAEYMIQFVNEGDFSYDSLPIFVLHFSIFKEFNKEECLKVLVESLSSKLDEFDDITPSESSIKFLLWYTMLFLKPQGMDVLLPINNPAVSLLCKVISQTELSSNSQVRVGLICCYILLQDAKSSSTVYTDAIVFLGNCIEMSVFTSSSTASVKSKKIKKFEDKSKIKTQEKNSSQEEFKLSLFDKEDTDLCVGLDNQVLYLSAIFLSGFVKTYRKYPQSKIMFRRVTDIINQFKMENYPALIKNAIAELKELLDILQTATLTPVVKAAKKPKALRQYEPSFHTITEGKRSLRGLPAEKQEEQKLLHKYKSEMKGAMRELRRDRVFLANVKLGEKSRSDAERIKKVKEIFGSAAAQQGELRSLKRKK